MISSTLSVNNQIIHRTVLPNGLVIVAVENSAADIIAARIFIRAGSCYEQRSQAGQFGLLSALLTKGTPRLSSLEIAEQVESVGAHLGADTSTDYSLMSLKTVSADFPALFSLAAELLRSPSFPQSEVELEQRLTVQSLRSMQEQPFTVAYNQLRQVMYRDHPYALPGLGTEESVLALDREMLHQTHQTYFRPDNMVVSITGRIAPEQSVALVEQVLGDWRPPAKPLPPLIFPLLSPNPCRMVIPQETNQSIVMVGYLAAAVKQPAYPALKLLITHLGNGLSSRLFVELREKRGLAYDVSAFYPTRLGVSQFVAYMGTAPENTAIALESLQHEVERLCAKSLTAEELQVAKNKLLGQYALGKQTNAQIAQLLGWYEILGLGVEFDQRFQAELAAVTVEETQAFACEFFTDPFVSIVGPAQAVDPLMN